ncbi:MULTISPECIES: LPXTG cell wall anchor domain-containing protein [unclassified Agrococcus]|uniref:LPXTG cell wall anchor domain-containing protein n=1 Tax=unclassified Agrococcus TaxID=2615065 RepID=UPI00362409E7
MPRPLRRALSAGLVTLLASAGVVGLGASVAQADSTQTFSGTLATGDSTFQRPEACDSLGTRGPQFYDAQPFTVPETGGYRIEMTSSTFTPAGGAPVPGGDGFFVLYEGAFDPAAPTVNCVDVDDDGSGTLLPQIDRLLTAGVAYTLVTTQYSATAPSDNVFSYSTTISGVVPAASIALAAGQPEVTTPGEPIRLAVTFSEPVTGFEADDVDVDGRFEVAPQVVVTGSGADYVVELDGVEGYGAFVVRVGAGAAVDAAGNETLGTDEVVAFVGPGVTVTPLEASTSTGPAVFDIVFDDAVEGLEAADLQLGGTALPSFVELTGEGAEYRATVSGFANAGSVDLTVPAFAAAIVFDLGEGGRFEIPNAASNTASVAFAPAGPSVTVEQAPEQGDPTSTLPVAFDVRFSEPIDELQASDVVLGGTAGSTTVSVEAVAGDAPNMAYRVTVLDAAQAGTITVSIPAGAVVNQDLVGNTASTSVDNTVTYAPVVAPAPTTPAAPPVAGAGGTLPQTGGEPGILVALAAMLLVAVGAVAARRGARITR